MKEEKRGVKKGQTAPDLVQGLFTWPQVAPRGGWPIPPIPPQRPDEPQKAHPTDSDPCFW